MFFAKGIIISFFGAAFCKIPDYSIFRHSLINQVRFVDRDKLNQQKSKQTVIPLSLGWHFFLSGRKVIHRTIIVTLLWSKSWDKAKLKLRGLVITLIDRRLNWVINDYFMFDTCFFIYFFFFISFPCCPFIYKLSQQGHRRVSHPSALN